MEAVKIWIRSCLTQLLGFFKGYQRKNKRHKNKATQHREKRMSHLFLKRGMATPAQMFTASTTRCRVFDGRPLQRGKAFDIWSSLLFSKRLKADYMVIVSVVLCRFYIRKTYGNISGSYSKVKSESDVENKFILDNMLNQDYEKRLYVRAQCDYGEEATPDGPLMSPLKPDRFRSPTKCPNADRFIPSRSENWETKYAMISENSSLPALRKARESGETGRDGLAYSYLLKNEVLGSNIEDIKTNCDERKALSTIEGSNLFHYQSPKKRLDFGEPTSPYSLSPVSCYSQKLLRSPRKATRKISRIPFKVLDAPELQDDFYLNLVDWSSQNVLSVGLGSCVYLWSACNSQVTRLCDLSGDGNSVTSVAWNERGNLVAVGTHHGQVQVWDVTAGKQVNNLQGHAARVGALAWNNEVLSSGSRDRSILQRDVRTPETTPHRRLVAHRQEVCGLRWSPDNQLLASGGNDNRLFVWNLHSSSPMQTYGEHIAAVKAIAWSPHHHGLLASAGGTADRCIRFWNTLTAQPMQCVDTGSQVCNLAWSKHSSELVSTHGYSQNQILVWKYPSLVQVAKLTGHSYRVLYLAMSPDGESIVTGAGDETLRFWSVFSKARTQKENRSVLNLFTNIR